MDHPRAHRGNRFSVRRTLAYTLTLLLLTTSSAFPIGFDQTFGNGGKVMISFSDAGQPSSYGRYIFIQPSARLVVVGGHTQQGASTRQIGVAVAGLAITGALDTLYGTDGKILLWSPTSDRYLMGASMGSNGSLLLLTQTWESVSNNRPELLRFTPAGQPDPNFNADVDLFPNQTSPINMSVDGNGKIYVLVRNGTSFYLVRLNDDGSRDTTFGTNGTRDLDLNRFHQPTLDAIRAQPDGKLLMTGTFTDANFRTLSFIARFDSDANIDRSFGYQGVVWPDIPGGIVFLETLRFQNDSKPVFAGSWTFLGSNSILLRTTHRGRLDAAFGSRGLSMNSFNDINSIHGLGINENGKIVAGGVSATKALPSNARVLLMIYSSSGALEQSLVTNFLGDREALVSDLTLQANGKILVAGYTQNLTDTRTQMVVARFDP